MSFLSVTMNFTTVIMLLQLKPSKNKKNGRMLSQWYKSITKKVKNNKQNMEEVTTEIFQRSKKRKDSMEEIAIKT